MSTTTILNFPVVEGYSNAQFVFGNLSEPYTFWENTRPTQRILSLSVHWKDRMEILRPKDILHADFVGLYDVDKQNKFRSFEESQERVKKLENNLHIAALETPFILAKQREQIQSMFAFAKNRRALITRVQIYGKRNPNYDSFFIIVSDLRAFLHFIKMTKRDERQTEHYVKQSRKPGTGEQMRLEL